MPNLFQKLVQFSRHLKIGGRLREFNFLKLNSKSFLTYQIDVSDEAGKRHEFSLCYDGFDWKLSGEKIPNWIEDAGEILKKEVTAQQDNINPELA
jgi:hypothetical protein